MYAQSTVFTKVKICSLFILTSALIAVFASLNVSFDAIHSDTEENMEKWAEINRIYAEKWPMINEKKEPPSDSKDWENVNNKFEKYFSKKPGK